MPDAARPMPPRTRLLAAALAAAALTLLPPASAPATAEELPFRRPPGWMPEPAATPGLRQAGRDFAQGHAAILSSGPLARDGSLEASLAQVLAALPGLPLPPPDAEGGGMSARGQRIAFARRNGSEGVLDAVVVDDGSRRSALLLQARGLAPRHALLARDAFDATVRGLPPAPGLPPPTPPGDAGGLDGAFTGLHVRHRPNGEGDEEVLVDTWVLVFDPSGLFSRVVPVAEGGVPAHCRASPADCGTYALFGGGWLRRPDRIRLTEGSGRYGLLDARELPFARQDAALQLGETRLDPAAVLPSGALLDGTWSMLAVSAESSERRELSLSRDGRFRRSLERDEGTRRAKHSESAGRYRLDGFRLLLQAEDGSRDTLSLLQPVPDHDGLLLIDGEAFLKRAPATETTE